MSAFSYHVLDIIIRGTNKEVRNFDALAVITLMANEATFGDFPMVVLPDSSGNVS